MLVLLRFLYCVCFVLFVFIICPMLPVLLDCPCDFLKWLFVFIRCLHIFLSFLTCLSSCLNFRNISNHVVVNFLRENYHQFPFDVNLRRKLTNNIFDVLLIREAYFHSATSGLQLNIYSFEIALFQNVGTIS